jgi:hypothetical protein
MHRYPFSTLNHQYHTSIQESYKVYPIHVSTMNDFSPQNKWCNFLRKKSKEHTKTISKKADDTLFYIEEE